MLKELLKTVYFACTGNFDKQKTSGDIPKEYCLEYGCEEKNTGCNFGNLKLESFWKFFLRKGILFIKILTSLVKVGNIKYQE